MRTTRARIKGQEIQSCIRRNGSTSARGVFVVHCKEGRGAHFHLDTLVLPLRFLQIELGHRSERGEVLSKQNESLDAVVTQRRVVMYGPLAVLESDDDGAHYRTCLLYTSPSPRD